MTKRDDIKKQIEEEDKRVYGETSISGSMPDPGSDDDVGEMYKKVVGHEPKGKTMAEEVEEAEKVRRGGIPHEGEEKEK